MLWELRFQRDRFSLEAGQAKGRELPQWFVNQPLVDETGRFYIDAFFDLSTDRSGPGLPIPRRDIADYSDRMGLEWDVARVFAIMIRRLDAAYLEWARQQSSSGD